MFGITEWERLALCLSPGRLVPDSPAERCGQLYIYDELLAVNAKDVSKMDHGDIVSLIKASSTQIYLTVQQPSDLEKMQQVCVCLYVCVCVCESDEM